MTAENTQRDMLTRLGNWHDAVDVNGDGSLIAQLKVWLTTYTGGSGRPILPINYERDIRNRVGNFQDLVDAHNNGSLTAMARAFGELFADQSTRIGAQNRVLSLTADHAAITAENNSIYRFNTTGHGGGLICTIPRNLGASIPTVGPGIDLRKICQFTIERNTADATNNPIIVLDDSGIECGRIISPCAVIVPYLIAYADGLSVTCKGVP